MTQPTQGKQGTRTFGAPKPHPNGYPVNDPDLVLASGDPAALAQAARETAELERVAKAMERRAEAKPGAIDLGGDALDD